VSRFWFTYCDHSGALLAALIMDSPSLLQAQNRAAVEGADSGAPYCEGYELDRDSANLIPAEAIGRMLDREEVRRLIREIEGRVFQKPAAASVKRRGSIPTRCPRQADRTDLNSARRD
jgi:hypothetical protein